MSVEPLFLELIQLAVGTRDRLSKVPSEEEWQKIYAQATKQSLMGILYSGIEIQNKTDVVVLPPDDLFFIRYGDVAKIEHLNKKRNDAAAALYTIFKNGGLRSCVLKGQGLALLYPDPLKRQSGDIDLWVEGSREEILRFLKDSGFETGKVVIHHVDAHVIADVETEIHFLPSYSYNYLRYLKYKKFFKEEADRQFEHFDGQRGFAYPTNPFNAVYLLLHIFRHVFSEGIGLRQLMDYYYVLTQLTDEEREWAYGKLRWLGLERMTGAVMYVLKRVFLIEDRYLLCSPLEKEGEFLLDEIFQGGNFGQYGKQYNKTKSSKGLKLYLLRLKRLRKVAGLCPSEVLWAPFWKPCHWLWRKAKGYA